MSSRSITHFSTLEKEEFQLLEKSQITEESEYEKWRKLTTYHYQLTLKDKPNWEYRPYQPDFAALYCYRHRNLVGLSMGGGKTLISALVFASIYSPEDDRPGRIHVTVPNHLAARRWIEDLEAVPSLRNRFEYIRSTKVLRKTTSPIIIYNHDLPKQKKRGQAVNHKYMRKHLRPSILCIDEVHNLKPKTNRTKALLTLRLVSKRTLALSGTLSDGDIAYTPFLCRFIYQEDFPYQSPKEFSQYFSVNQRLSTSYDSGSSNGGQDRYLRHLDLNRLPEYYQLMTRFCHRVSLDDPVVKPYITKPESKKETHIVTPSQDQLNAHRYYLSQHRQTIEALSESQEDNEETILSILHPLIRIANAYSLSTPKLEKLKEEILTEDKTAIFCATNSGARTLCQYLKSFGYSLTRIYANDEQETPTSLPEEKRMKRIDQFLGDESISVCVLQINLASEAIDLQNAGKVIFYDLPWSSIKVEQAIARTVRPGNPRSEVEVTFIANQGLIDEHQLNLIESKIELSNLLFDYSIDSKREGISEKDVIDDLLEDI